MYGKTRRAYVCMCARGRAHKCVVAAKMYVSKQNPERHSMKNHLAPGLINAIATVISPAADAHDTLMRLHTHLDTRIHNAYIYARSLAYVRARAYDNYAGCMIIAALRRSRRCRV